MEIFFDSVSKRYFKSTKNMLIMNIDEVNQLYFDGVDTVSYNDIAKRVFRIEEIEIGDNLNYSLPIELQIIKTNDTDTDKDVYYVNILSLNES